MWAGCQGHSESPQQWKIQFGASEPSYQFNRIKLFMLLVPLSKVMGEFHLPSQLLGLQLPVHAIRFYFDDNLLILGLTQHPAKQI